MKILVTGGAGFIGSHLVDRLVQGKNQVVVVDNLSTGKKRQIHSRAAFYEQDITDVWAVKRIFAKERPAYVFHLAALPRVPLSVKDPVGTSNVNIMGTLHVLKAALDNKVKRVVLASSSSVYGNRKTLPLKENMTPQPVSPYALQKLVGEQFARLFAELYGLSVVCLRYFNVYGPRADVQSDYSLVIGKFLRLRKEGKPLTVFGDGKQTRAFCYVDDVVEATIESMRAKIAESGTVINIGGSKSHSIEKVAEIIGGKVSYLPPRPGDVRNTKASNVLAKKLLGWQPKVDFEDGMQRTKNWFQNH